MNPITPGRTGHANPAHALRAPLPFLLFLAALWTGSIASGGCLPEPVPWGTQPSRPACAVLDVDGGVLQVWSYQLGQWLTLTVPRDALAQPTRICLSLAPAPAVDGWLPQCEAWHVDTGGIALAQPATLSLPWRAMTPLQLWQLDDGGRPTAVREVTPDPASMAFHIPTTRTGTFWLASYQRPIPPVPVADVLVIDLDSGTVQQGRLEAR